MLRQISAVISTKQNKTKQGKKFVSFNARKHLVFEIQSNNVLTKNPLHFCLWGHLKPLVYSDEIVNEETLHQRILMSAKPFETAPAPLKE